MKHNTVYAWMDGETCFYIGIGTSNRPYNYTGRSVETKTARKIAVNKGTFQVKILLKNIDRDLACFVEKKLIKNIGRIDNNEGPLTNHTDGGDGFGEGKRVFSEKHKSKMRGKNNSFYGKKHSEELIRKQCRPVRTDKGYFLSVSEASRKLEIAKSTIRRRIKLANWPDYKYISLEEFDSKPEYIPVGRQKSLAQGNPKQVLTPKGVFRCAADAALVYGVSAGVIRGWCTNQKEKYNRFRYLKEIKGPQHVVKTEKPSKARPIIADKVKYGSSRDCSRKTGIAYSTISYRLKSDHWTEWYYIEE